MQKMYGNKVGMEETQEYNYPTTTVLYNIIPTEGY